MKLIMKSHSIKSILCFDASTQRHTMFRPKLAFLVTIPLILVSFAAEIEIYSENTDDFATGVPFNEWLRHVEIEIPAPTGPFGNPLQMTGGNCSNISINGFLH